MVDFALRLDGVRTHSDVARAPSPLRVWAGKAEAALLHPARAGCVDGCTGGQGRGGLATSCEGTAVWTAVRAGKAEAALLHRREDSCEDYSMTALKKRLEEEKLEVAVVVPPKLSVSDCSAV